MMLVYLEEIGSPWRWKWREKESDGAGLKPGMRVRSEFDSLK